MLSPDDAAVVDRDPALPGLGLLLDTEGLTEWMRTSVGPVVELRPRHMRYQPGISCVLALDLVRPDGVDALVVTASSLASAVRLGTTSEMGPRGAVLAFDEGRRLLAHTVTVDRDLPALQCLGAAQQQRQLLTQLLPDTKGLSNASVSTLSHTPHRRWIGLVAVEGERVAILRAYRPRKLHSVLAAWRSIPVATRRTPVVLGVAPELGILATEYVHGTALAQRTASLPRSAYEQLGETLASLHAQDFGRSLGHGRDAQVRHLIAAGRTLRSIMPGQEVEVTRLLEHLIAPLVRVGPGRLVHGDLSFDQAMLTTAGHVVLVGLECGDGADPAVDLASLTAQLWLEVATGVISPQEESRRLTAVHDGYSRIGVLPDPDRLRAHTAAQLVGHALQPFRARDPDWRTTAQLMLQRATVVAGSIRAGNEPVPARLTRHTETTGAAVLRYTGPRLNNQTGSSVN